MHGKMENGETTFVVANDRPHGFYLRKWIVVILTGVGLAGIVIYLSLSLLALGIISGSTKSEFHEESVRLYKCVVVIHNL